MIRPPEEAVEAATRRLWAHYQQDDLNPDFPMENFPHAAGMYREKAEVVLSSEPVQELVEALRDEHLDGVAMENCVFRRDGSCSTCDLIRRWTQEEGTE